MAGAHLVALPPDVEAGRATGGLAYTGDHGLADVAEAGELYMRDGDTSSKSVSASLLSGPVSNSGPRSHGHRSSRARSPSPVHSTSVMMTPPSHMMPVGSGPVSAGRAGRQTPGSPLTARSAPPSANLIPMLRMQPKYAIAVISAVALIGLLVIMTAVVSGGPTASTGHPLCKPEEAGAVAFVASLKTVTTPADRIRQSNAVRSWLSISPLAQVFIVGSEDVRSFAESLGATFVPDVQSSPSGVPYLSDMILKMKQRSPYKLLSFLNADIILPHDFVDTLTSICAAFNADDKVLAIGRRFDIPLNDSLSFEDPAVTATMLEDLTREPQAFLQNNLYKDYFVFNRILWAEDEVPTLAIGRAGIDDWMVKSALVKRAAVVDITPAATVYHQIHSYGHVAGGQKGAWAGIDAAHNREVAGDLTVLTDVNRATYQVRRQPSGARYVARQWDQMLVRELYLAGVIPAVRYLLYRTSSWVICMLVAPFVLLLGVYLRRQCLRRFKES